MADDKAAPRSFTLNVKIKCCATCPEKARKKLLKLDGGVDSVLYDAKQGLMRVSGTVDPKILIQKFATWGKKAELLCPQMNPTAEDQSFSPPKQMDSDSDSHKTKTCSCSCSATGPDNYSMAKRTELLPAMDTRSMRKTKKGFFGLFGKKKAGYPNDQECLLAKTPAAREASKWRFPRTPMAGAGGPRAPFFPQYGRPYPPAYGRPMMESQFGPHGSVPVPLMAPPYGFFYSRPPPVTNPMVHYTSYEDNYRFW